MEGKRRLEALLEKLRGCRYVLLVLLAGLVLLLLPTGGGGGSGGTQDGQDAPETVEAGTEERGLEARLQEILSLVEGAGQVRVLLTEEDGGERVLARDSRSSLDTQGDSERREQEDTAVTVQKSGGGSEAVEVSRTAPKYRGAVVAAQGADSPRVCLELLEAVKAATGLTAEAIKIVKMK